MLWAIGGIGFVAIGAAALVYANDWWLSGVVTGSILCWLTGVSGGDIQPARAAAGAGGCGRGVAYLYVLARRRAVVSRPGGPWLLTTQALVHIETKWLGREPPAAARRQSAAVGHILVLDGRARVLLDRQRRATWP